MKNALFIVFLAIIGAITSSCTKENTHPQEVPCPYLEAENLKITPDFGEKNEAGDSLWQDAGDYFLMVDKNDQKNITVVIKSSGECLFSHKAALAAAKKVGGRLPSYEEMYSAQSGVSGGWYKIKKPATGIYIHNAKTTGSGLHLPGLSWGIWGEEGIDYSLLFCCILGPQGHNSFVYTMGISSTDMVNDLLSGDFSGEFCMSVCLAKRK